MSKKEKSNHDKLHYVNLYESEDKVYTRRISGFYQKLRRYTGIPLLLGYLLLPWLVIDDRPAVLFDLPARQFHILWSSFWPQDAIYLAWLLIISAFLLFTVTVLVGRVWCGFTCPQTVWTQMFIWAEHLCEGDRNQRIKLDAQAWNLAKLLRKSATMSIWLVISLITSLTFVGYFTPIRDLVVHFFTLTLAPAPLFWVGLFTLMTYLNAGFMREQVCKYMCPYARFQAVMYDQNTLSVVYNYIRGEKRGSRKLGESYQNQGLGDCIDCSWCVQVCPVDIDIRDGMQYECIDCGLCVDACNAVMDKMNYPKGLISFSTQKAIEQGKAEHGKTAFVRPRFFRPRVIGYASLLLIMVGVFVYSIATRVPVELEIHRDRSANMYRVQGQDIQNVYTLKISNMDRSAHVYDIEIESGDGFRIEGYQYLIAAEGELLSLPIRVVINQHRLQATKTDIRIRISAQADKSITATATTTFIGPSL